MKCHVHARLPRPSVHLKVELEIVLVDDAAALSRT
jgi:hypothetical protein